MATVQLPSDPSAPLTPTAIPPPSTTPRPANELAIATRKSTLARVQTAQIASLLTSAHPHLTTKIIALDTTADIDKVTPLHGFNAKALWTTELEDLLSRRDVDLIVHSLKDMPTQLPAGLVLGAVAARTDPRDAVCVSPALAAKGVRTLAQLPEGSVVGTSSLRRSAQCKMRFPGLAFADCRGNIGTRLGKLDAEGSEFDALILAAAGLKRIGMEARISSYLSWEEGGIMHAVGQGALGIEICGDDEKTRKLVEAVVDEKAMRGALAERSLMRTLEGGCSVPIGVETEWVKKSRALGSTAGSGVGIGAKPAAEYDKLTGKAVAGSEASQGESEGDGDDRSDEFVMRAIVVSLDGKKHVNSEMRRMIRSREEADQLGWDMAKKLVELGAEKILEEITLNRGIIQKQGEA